MLELSRGYVAYLLAGFGEPGVSAAILRSSDTDFRRVQEAANQGAVEGKEWLKVACRTAVEIVEQQARELRRREWLDADFAFFEERFRDYSQENREELRSDHGRTVKGWDRRI